LPWTKITRKKYLRNGLRYASDMTDAERRLIARLLLSLGGLGLDLGAFQIMAIKSRVHFRRGFHDNGFAKTILLVEPTEPFLGTVHLDQLPYQNVDLKRFYPYGDPAFPG
jgi:microcystin degradation protein MlrC